MGRRAALAGSKVAIAIALCVPLAAHGQISGSVLEQGTLDPIPGARVSMQASNVEALGDPIRCAR